ncbi:hypothetical protein [Blastococcus sp. CT_GayMR16]|uniref:hypothetical protein n=1 Tax=Blastococcus sp. CT_GayMR16 TaxID=2559607 RepID=UPI0010740B6E|nr:hypothetical protein [Blastococcus sp. CT_GayMR16]TFV83167.1 hypothetical protein E4P38_21155 [Blastococcus sp. CT_GayMR16]
MASEMATRSPSFVDGKSQNAQELRLHVLSSGGGATPLASRGGVRPSGGNPGLVAALATPVMKVRVNAGIADIPSTSVSGGFYRVSWDQVDLDIDASSAQARTDLVIVEVIDTGTAAATGKVRILKGTPGAGRPTNALANAHWMSIAATAVRVAAESSGNIRAQDVTPELKYAVAPGAPVPVSSKAERDALDKYLGLSVKRLDLGGLVQRWTGTVWAEGSDVPVFASNAARDTYYTGNLHAGAKALVGDNEQYYSGSKWKYETTGRVLYTVGAPTTDAGGAYTFPHGLGVTPSSIQVTTTQQASDLLQRIGVVKVLNYDAANIVVGLIRTDTSAYLTNSLLSLDWTATA